MSLSFVDFSLIKLELGPSVTAIGQIGANPPSPSVGNISNLQIPWRDLQATPFDSALLSWHTRLSDFVGEEKIHILKTWAESPPAISIKFITGDGGVGKSRLAAEFAERLKIDGWSAGFVDLRKGQNFPYQQQGALLVIDYPEENLGGVRELLKDLAGLGNNRRIRILFLSRKTIDDWQELIHASHASDLVEKIPLHLRYLDFTSAHRLYCSALEKAAEKYHNQPTPVSEEALSHWLKLAPENVRALFILAAALYSAAHPEDDVVKYQGREMMKGLVKRECDRLCNIARSLNLEDVWVLPRILAMAAIAGKLTLPEVVASQSLLGCQAENNLEKKLREAGVLSQGVVRAPQPDIFAAAFTVEVLAQRVNTAQ